MARVVRFHSSVAMVGLDRHDGLYYFALFNGMLAPFAPPYIPLPTPSGFQTLHLVEVPINWISLKDKTNSTVIADGAPIVSADHTAQKTIHIPPGINVLVPIVILLGEANWKLGVSSVLAAQGAVASTVAGSFGMTLNCADPVSMPCGVYQSPGSVHVSPSAGDFGDVVAEWAFTELINLIVQAGLGKAGKHGPRMPTGTRSILTEIRIKTGVSFRNALGKTRARRYLTKNVGELAREGGKKFLEKLGGDEGKDTLKKWGWGPEPGDKFPGSS